MSPGVFVLRFDRGGLLFEPGQYVNLGIPGLSPGASTPSTRVMMTISWKCSSGRFPGGSVSPALSRCQPGDSLVVEGPYGLFVTDAGERILVGSGTGISPFHCLVKSSPGVD